jgi:hypothetical protein
MRRLTAAGVFLATLLGTLLASRMAAAQATLVPTYHGILSIRRATGTIDRDSGDGTLKVRKWTALLTPDTNGIAPAAEPVEVSVGLNDQRFPLPPGALKASKSGRVFAYKAKRSAVTRGLQSFRFWRQRDGSYGIRFTLVGLSLSRLRTEDPICVPVAVIIGDDDFFNGVSLTSPTFFSKRVVVPESCPVNTDDWPWLNG